MNNGHTNPTTTIRKASFAARSGIRRSGTIPNTTRRWDAVYQEQDETKLQGDAQGDDAGDSDKGGPTSGFPTPYLFHGLVALVKTMAANCAPAPFVRDRSTPGSGSDQDLKKKDGPLSGTRR